MFRLVAAILTLLVLAPAASAHASTVTPPPPEHRADPSLTTYVHRLGPYTIGSYETLLKSAVPKPPPVAGAIVAMDARLVDKAGHVIPQQVTMLHHLVFTNGGPDGKRGDPMCPQKSTRERFWGTSEELRPMTLPPGYGYPTDPADQWHAFVMVMHHRAGDRQFYVEYRMTVDTRPVIPVKPYWLSIVPCSPDPQWTVPGSGTKTQTRDRTFTIPAAGRIVAAGGHLHGGAQAIELSQPRCKDRTLVRNQPAYAPAGDPLYKVRPLLHEPDPKNISWWQSATGWPIKRGEQLKVTAAYDNMSPHTRVMGIEHVYVAPPLDPKAANGCASGPTDAQRLGAEFTAARMTPPTVTLTLARLDRNGIARATTKGTGTQRTVHGDFASVFVRDFTYGPQQLTVPRGATVRWHFADAQSHDVTLANGPEGFASPWLKAGDKYSHTFEKPGTYLLQCSLHSAQMSQVVKVTRARPRPRDEDPLRR
ncbi:plastocyanin/azurin family copper-binding protein [Solirubrobacter ginsenosidimutans]|uniref:Plastocyanin/azurin family copper-binding protein n=1 Tax=Solirubrobacter ginsenosidimutans TaxID=490573 RepID=A0A9X3N1B3_9ACTN|nr:plastocyanin/azurin family copper-binding protein [Solirubrobacter ginsenosidimutans]MDA0166639.1 plastocyanin/azurin family copper-binding protein [Solirubrobacter ginsenosidimutans]